MNEEKMRNKYMQLKHKGISSDDVFSVIKFDLGTKYYQMKKNGVAPEIVYQEIERDVGGWSFEAVRMLREVFSFSLDEAKRVVFKAMNDGGEILSEETQNEIIKELELTGNRGTSYLFP